MFLWLSSALFLLTFANSTLPADDPKQPTKTTVEFRLAETEAKQGLTEATISGTSDKVYLHKQIELTQQDIARAMVQIDDVIGRPSIHLVFNEAGAKKIAKLTGEHQGKLLAIVINGKVVTAPRIVSPLKSNAVISGMFTLKEAKRIAEGISPPKKD